MRAKKNKDGSRRWRRKLESEDISLKEFYSIQQAKTKKTLFKILNITFKILY